MARLAWNQSMLGRLDEGVRFMTTTIRQAHWGLLVLVFVLAVGLGLFAQSSSAAVSPSSSPVTRDLNTILSELMRASPATSQDLSDLQPPGGMLHRVTFWRGDKVQKAMMVAALRRNSGICESSFERLYSIGHFIANLVNAL